MTSTLERIIIALGLNKNIEVGVLLFSNFEVRCAANETNLYGILFLLN